MTLRQLTGGYPMQGACLGNGRRICQLITMGAVTLFLGPMSLCFPGCSLLRPNYYHADQSASYSDLACPSSTEPVAELPSGGRASDIQLTATCEAASYVMGRPIVVYVSIANNSKSTIWFYDALLVARYNDVVAPNGVHSLDILPEIQGQCLPRKSVQSCTTAPLVEVWTVSGGPVASKLDLPERLVSLRPNEVWRGSVDIDPLLCEGWYIVSVCMNQPDGFTASTVKGAHSNALEIVAKNR